MYPHTKPKMAMNLENISRNFDINRYNMTKEELLIEQEKIKLQLLKLDLEEKKNPKKIHSKIDPVLATILVALIGFLGTTVVSVYNSVKEKEFKQKEFETDLIKKSLEQPTKEARIDLLTFINNLKLIKNKEVSSSLDSLLKNPEDIPSISVNSTPTFREDPIEVDPEFRNAKDPVSLLALKAAQKNVGVSEDDIQNNTGKNISKFMRGGSGIPWSCSFVSWCFSQNPKGTPPFKFSHAWVLLRNELKVKKKYSTDLSKIKVGDIYFLKSSDIPHHGGIVEKVEESSIIGIEGNIDNKVGRKKRNFDAISGIGRID